MAIPIDPHYIPAFSIEDVLLDKDTGAPLTGGLVYFYEDEQRGILKPVYQISGTSPNYTFVELPNPITLSAIGTFEDALDNPTIPYFYPYDADGNIELYYIVVTSSTGVPQFTRQAQPFIEGSGGGTGGVGEVITNEISNPQFAKVLFNISTPYVISVNNVSGLVYSIAPDWDLIITAPGAGTITLNQITPPGSLNVVSNPATILNITTAGISSLQLRQRIFGSPNLWGSGYLGVTFVAKTYSGTSPNLNLYYSQSDGTVIAQLLLSASLLATNSYAAYAGSALIPVSTNPDTFPGAYIDIYFDLPLSIEIDITSVMVAKTGTVNFGQNVFYDQESYERQIDHLFHYYKPQLEFKPIPSFLVGWDFPLNPMQIAGPNVGPINSGNNTAFYTWDQTIVFQTVTNSVTINQSTTGNGAIVLATGAGNQMGILQYLPYPTSSNILVNRICSMINATATTNMNICVSMWYTANSTVPAITSTFFSGLDATGFPTGITSGWNMVPRGLNNYLGNAIVTLTPNYLNYPLQGWDLNNFLTAAGAKFFAIFIGTAPVGVSAAVGFKSVSLNAGDIPTNPAPQTPDDVRRECQYYYEITGTLAQEMLINPSPYLTAGTTLSLVPRIFNVNYGIKRVNPTITVRSPITGTANFVNGVLFNAGMTLTPGDISIANWTQQVLTPVSAIYEPNNVNGEIGTVVGSASYPEAFITYNAIVDARLGVV